VLKGALYMYVLCSVPAADTLMTVAGTDSTGVLDAVGINALFNGPSGMVFVPELGGLVIADTANSQLRVLYMNNSVLTVSCMRRYSPGYVADAAC
jgi:hypothetical protein